MKISIFVLLLGLMFTQALLAQTADLFFSEYIEGSANNKALEIFNGTGSDVDLSSYIIKTTYNGNDWSSDYYSFPAGSVLANGDVWVVANEGASQEILDQADDVLAYNAGGYVVSFNGNDARGLYKIEGKDEVLIDIIGVPGVDPGDGWDVAGVAAATKDHTLIRKPTVSQGNTDWTSSAGTNAEDSEWIVQDRDYFSDLGHHTYNGGPDNTPPTILSATATSSTTVNVAFSEPVTSETANVTDNYQINSLTVSSATLQANGLSVVLKTSEQTENQTYTLTVNNIQDLAGNTIEDNSTINFTGYQGVTYTPIAEIQDNFDTYNGTQVTVSGVVTIGDGLLHPGKTQFYIEDGSGKGIQIYNGSPLSTTYNRGDRIEVTGTIGLYEGTSGKYHDVQITDPTVTLLSQGENLPSAHTLTGAEDFTMNGTWAKVNGTISDIWDASEQYHFYKITVDLDNGASSELMYWNSAVSPDSISQYIIGDKITSYGVITFYQSVPQLTCGYAQDINYYTGNGYDFLTYQPETPEAGTDLKLIFNNNQKYDFVDICWKTNKDLSYNTQKMESSTDSTEFYYTFVAPKAGTSYQVYFEAFSDTIRTIFPDTAPQQPISIEIPSLGLIAKLTIQPKPFNPHIGEKFPIQISGENGDKAIVRIFNSEGKLKTTLFNGIISTNSGIFTINWDGKDKNYNILPIGLYIVHLEVIDRNTGKSKTDKAPIVIGTYLK